MNETIVTVVGNVASDLRTRRVGEDDGRVVNFRVASSERRFDRARNEWVDGDRFSAWVSCWRHLGDGVLKSLAKGDPVVVTGRLSVREYEADGVKRYSTEITAWAVGPDLARSSAEVQRRRLAAVPDVSGDGAVELRGGEPDPASAGPDEDGSGTRPGDRDTEEDRRDGVRVAAV